MFLTVLASRAFRYALPAWFAVAASATLAAAASGAAELPDTVATVQGQKISAEELTASLRGDLLQLEMQRYRTLKKGLDEMIAAKLIAIEAELKSGAGIDTALARLESRPELVAALAHTLASTAVPTPRTEIMMPAVITG